MYGMHRWGGGFLWVWEFMSFQPPMDPLTLATLAKILGGKPKNVKKEGEN